LGLVTALKARNPDEAMAKSAITADLKPPPRLDRTVATVAQGEEADRPEGGVHRGRLRVRTLVTLRWLVVAGETVLLLLVALLFGLQAPYALCFAVVGVSAWLNLLTGVASPGQREFGDREAAAQLLVDILQISALVFLTGGAGNPFMLMLIAPATLAAATLPARFVVGLGAIASLIAVALIFAYMPLPQPPGVVASLPFS